MGTKNISSLKLSPTAKKAAEELLKQFPEVEFTSGKRNAKDQARAMASNVVKKRDFIKKTYVSNEASKACQKWVDDHPQAIDKQAIADGLMDTFKQLGVKVGQISKHLTGDAFDVQPVSANAAEIKKAIRKLPGLKKFLEKEAGLVRWHAQF